MRIASGKVVDGRVERLTESDWFGFVLEGKMPGEETAIALLRDGQRLSLKLPLQ